jgi:hypothetical protein
MKTFKIFLVVFLLNVISINLTAQPGDPDPPGDDPVPITGLEWLLAGGGALGAYGIIRKKIRGNKKES